MSNQTDAWVQLVEFFESIAGKPLIGQNKFTRETDLYHDLDLEPKTIQSILCSWGSRFNVDMADFDIVHYYPASKLSHKDFLLTLLKIPFSRHSRETLGGWQLTLGMLEEAMILGKWKI